MGGVEHGLFPNNTRTPVIILSSSKKRQAFDLSAQSQQILELGQKKNKISLFCEWSILL